MAVTVTTIEVAGLDLDGNYTAELVDNGLEANVGFRLLDINDDAKAPIADLAFSIEGARALSKALADVAERARRSHTVATASGPSGAGPAPCLPPWRGGQGLRHGTQSAGIPANPEPMPLLTARHSPSRIAKSVPRADAEHLGARIARTLPLFCLATKVMTM